MLQVKKDASLLNVNIPYGMVEVRYPPKEAWREAEFREAAERELSELKKRHASYDRKAVFGENPYVRFFKKFKKTYPVLLQFESVVCKGRPFPFENYVTAVPFLLEMTDQVLSGTHDADCVEGGLTLFFGKEKLPFTGLRGAEAHTYPGDFCARDNGGLVFSEIAGVEIRSCARPDSRHVFYPIFGTPDMPGTVVADAVERLIQYVYLLVPTAQVESMIL